MKRTSPLQLVTALLMSCLMLFGAVAPALAAPPTQADDGGAMQVWASKVYPAADAPGMMEIIALYPNNAAELMTIYLTKGTIVETGTWESNADGGVDLQLTGTPEREYDQPVSLNLAPVDDQLTDGVFTYVALTIVTPEEMDALIESAGAETEAVAEDDAEMTAIGEVDSVWVSNVYPAADAPGLITVLALFANGAMEQTSVYLTKGTVTEVGEWEEDADGAIAVTVTGTLDEDYDQTSTVTYTRAGDTLTDGAFALSLWPAVTPGEMMAGKDPSGTYVTNVYPAADAAGYVVVLTLYANNNAEQTTIYLTKGAVTEVGTWEAQNDGSIALTITGTMEEEYAKSTVTVLSRTGDMLQDGALLFFLLSEITPAMMDAMLTPEVLAVFASDTLSAASSPGRVVTLTFFADNTLTMSTDYLNDEAPIVEIGTWAEKGDTVTVNLTGREDVDYDEPVVIVFEMDEDGQLVAVDYDEALFGSEGLTLIEQPVE